MRSVLFIAGTVLSFALLLQSADGQGKNATDPVTIGKAAVVGYSANVHAFSYYKCRYRQTKGQAKSVEDAISGKFLNSRFFDCRLTVDGEKDAYEGFAPTPDPKHAVEVLGDKRKRVLPILGNSDRYLHDGQREMNFDPFMKCINLFSANKSQRGISCTPLGMGIIGHRNKYGPDVLLSQPERYVFSVVGLEEFDNRPVVIVRLDEKSKPGPGQARPAYSRTLSFDTGKGYLPVRMGLIHKDKTVARVFVTNVRECSDQRWFPERTVVVYSPERQNSFFDVEEIKVLELDCDRRPSEEDFRFTIPAGTSVLEYGEGEKYFLLKQDEKIGVEDLPSLFDMLEGVKANPRMDTSVPKVRPYRWLTLAGGLFLAFGGLILLVRRRWHVRPSK